VVVVGRGLVDGSSYGAAAIGIERINGVGSGSLGEHEIYEREGWS
jgi:hypothetical protein